MRRPRRIALFGHDRHDSALMRRVAAFETEGASVLSLMFERVRAESGGPSELDLIDLGQTLDLNYVARCPRLLRGVLIALRHRARLRQCDVFYARNIDMLLVAAAVRGLLRMPVPLVYECLDVRSIFIGERWVNWTARAIERAALAKCDLVVLSSPDYLTHYFRPVQKYSGPAFVLENKVVGAQIPPSRRTSQARLPAGPPWVIGWFGVLKCRRSLEILRLLAQSLGDQVRIEIRGIPSENDVPRHLIDEVCASTPSMSFHGRYANPEDLAHIYGRVHLTWAADFLDAEANSKWCLPNRLYEGGLYRSLALAAEDTATGRMVKARNLGFTLPEPLEETSIAFMRGLDAARYEAARTVLDASPRSYFVDEDDTGRLLETIGGLVPRTHDLLVSTTGRTAA